MIDKALGIPPDPDDDESPDRRRRGRVTNRIAAGSAFGGAALSVYILSQVGGIGDQQTILLAAVERNAAAMHVVGQDIARITGIQDGMLVSLAQTKREYEARLDACSLARQSHDQRIDELERVARDPARAPQTVMRDLLERIAAHEEQLKAWTINLLSQRLNTLGLRAPDARSRLSQIGSAIDQLDPADPTHWTHEPGRRPAVAALQRLTDTPITASERDAAWAVHRLGGVAPQEARDQGDPSAPTGPETATQP
jgi:hypothetical protein